MKFTSQKGIALALVAGLIGPTVTQLGIDLAYHDTQRYAQLIVFLVCGTLIALHPSRYAPDLNGPQAFAALAIVVLATVSAMTSPHIAHSWIENSLFAGMAAFALVCAQLLRSQVISAALTYRLAAVFAILYFATFFAIYVVALFTPTKHLDIYELFGQFSSVRFFNHVQTVTTVLGIGALTDADHRWRKAGVVSLFLSTALLLLSAGRATMLALVIALPAMHLLDRNLLRQTWKPLVLAVPAGWILGLCLRELLFFVHADSNVVFAGISERTLSASSWQARFLLWSDAWNMALKHPWLGVGPMGFAAAKSQAAHPHNVTLQLLAEYGFVFTALLIGSIAIALAQRVRELRRGRLRDVTMTSVGIGALVAAAVDGQFSGNFVMPISQLWIAFAFAMAFAMPGARDAVAPATPNFSLAAGRACALAIALVFFAGIALGTQSAVLTRPSPHIDAPWLKWHSIYWPRLWQQGLIPGT